MQALNLKPLSRHNAWPLAAKVAALVLLVLGAKFLVLRWCSSPLPVFDQWQAEGQCLLQPWLRGELHLGDLFTPWNQHRIFWTRLLALGLFGLNGQWDTQVEAIAAEILHAATAGFLGVILIRGLGRASEDAVLICLALLFALPFAQESTLSGGFNSQYYFLLLFGVIAIWGLASHRPGSSAWWIGAGAAVMAWFSIATGGLPALAVAAWMGLRLARRDGSARENWTTLAAALALGVGGLCWNIGVGQRTELQPRSAAELLIRFAGLVGWPNPTAWAAPIAFGPYAWLLWRMVRNRGSSSRVEAFLLPLGLFVLLNTAALAYARNHYGGLAVSRYMDFLAIGALVNFACLLLFIREARERAKPARGHVGLGLLTLAWTATTGFGLAALTARNIAEDLPFVKGCSEHEVENVTAFIARHDVAAFVRKDPFEIQCEKPGIAVSLLQDPAILRILPWQVRPPLVLEAAPGSRQVRKVTGEPGNLGKTGWLLEPGPKGQPAYFRSRTISGPHLPYLRFPEISDLGDGVFLAVVDERSGAIIWLPENSLGTDWHSALVRVPANSFRVEAVTRAKSTRGLAFAYPREVGRLSAWVDTLLDSAVGFLFAGAGIWLAAICWARLSLPGASQGWPRQEALTPVRFTASVKTAPFAPANMPVMTSSISIRLTTIASAAAVFFAAATGVRAVAPPPPPPLELPKPPPAQVSSSEGAAPLPLPVTFQKRQERKNPPQPPVLITKIRTADNEDWARTPNDLKGLLEWMSAEMNVHFSSNIRTFDQVPEDAKNMPILYRSGYKAFELTPPEIQRLHSYVLNGGTIIFNSLVGDPAFYQSALKATHQILPERNIYRLRLDHPVFSSYYPITQVKYRERAIKDGVVTDSLPYLEGEDIDERTAIFVSRWDFSMGWEKNPADSWGYADEDARRIGGNIVAYVTAMRDAGKSVGKSVELVDADKKAADKVRVGQVIHAGPWKTRTAAFPMLLNQFHLLTGAPVSFELADVKLTDPAIFDMPILYLTGTTDFQLSEAERANLRQFLLKGGVLFAEAADGRPSFDAGFRAEMASVLPNLPLTQLPANHPIFMRPLNLAMVKARPALAVKRGNQTEEAPEMYGISVNGALGVIYSPNDLSAGWERAVDPYAIGYEPADATALGVSALFYAVTH